MYTAGDESCYFVLHKCTLPGKNANLYLVGDVFLRHFYSVYDFDKNQIAIGINTHSEGRVALYKPGEHPDDAQKAETSADNVQSTEGTTDGEEEDIETIDITSSSEHQANIKSQHKAYL